MTRATLTAVCVASTVTPPTWVTPLYSDTAGRGNPSALQFSTMASPGWFSRTVWSTGSTRNRRSAAREGGPPHPRVE